VQLHVHDSCYLLFVAAICWRFLEVGLFDLTHAEPLENEVYSKFPKERSMKELFRRISTGWLEIEPAGALSAID